MSAHIPHTFAIEFTANDVWTGADTYVATPCQCGIASGQVHSTLGAAQRAQMHICPSTRTYPVWDGTIVTL